jgi:hypothetical protein
VPAATPLTSPEEFTVATKVLELDHVPPIVVFVNIFFVLFLSTNREQIMTLIPNRKI